MLIDFQSLCWRAGWSSRDHQPTKHQNISNFSWLLTKLVNGWLMVNEEALFGAIRIWEQFIFHAHWMFLHRDNSLTSLFLNSELNCQGLLSIEAFCCSGRDKANSFLPQFLERDVSRYNPYTEWYVVVSSLLELPHAPSRRRVARVSRRW